MITLTEIGRWYPESLRLRGAQILREYLQYEILRAIFQSKFGNKYTFLGGTCLRIVHQTERFSEDLDFDNVGLTQEEFEHTAGEVKRHLELLGYEVALKFAYKGAFHCNIRFPALLYKYGLSGHKEAKLLIKLDTEKQHFDYERLTYTLNRFGVQSAIRATPLPILASQKVAAILGRKRPKGRDFYDLVFALRRVKPNYRYLYERLEIPSPEHLRDAVGQHIANFDFELLTKDVAPFLLNEADQHMVRNFPAYWETAVLR